MSRIDIEGALPPLREQGYSKERSTHWDHERQRQQFARCFSSPLPRIQNIACTVAGYDDNGLMETHYRIVSGPLCGTKVSVSMTAHGLRIVLSNTESKLIERLQRIQNRWQRQLHQLGFPCLLEVTCADESDA